MKVVKYTDVAVKDLKFCEPTPMARGGYTVNILDPSGNKVVFQTPRLRVPFGLSKFGDNDDKQSLCVSLGGQPEFASFLTSLNEHVLKSVAENHQAWFQKSAPEAVLREFFSSNVKESDKYDPTWRLPIPIYGGRCQASFFDAERMETDMNAITKGCTVLCLVELTGLWFVNKRFGIKWKPVQVLVHAPKDNGYAFLDE